MLNRGEETCEASGILMPRSGEHWITLQTKECSRMVTECHPQDETTNNKHLHTVMEVTLAAHFSEWGFAKKHVSIAKKIVCEGGGGEKNEVEP